MERNGFNPSSFETSGDKPDDSKETTKSKKKKSAEAGSEQYGASKKEVVADRTKSLLDKFLGEQKPEKLRPPEAKPDSIEVSNDEDEKLDEIAETSISAAESDGTAEDDSGLEEISPEEDATISRQLIDAKLAELEMGRDEAEAPDEAAGREAAIAMLEQMREEVSVVEPEPETEYEPESQASQPPELSDGLEAFDDEQTIPLSQTPSPKPAAPGGAGNSGRGSGPPIMPPPSPNAQPGGEPTTVHFGDRHGEHASATTARKAEYEPDYQANPNATYLWVGGVVGYLIGRRRGRIKTEKRLAVVQRKLEKQVEAKQREIEEKTETVRRLARENYVAPSRSEVPAEARQSKPEAAQRHINAPEASVAPRPAPPEHSPANQPGLSAPERSKVSREHQETKAEKSIELSTTDIKRLSETITIGATNLRKIHEAKLITDSGLRRLVTEHLQGKDIRRGLAREFLAKELSYERDPHFRDLALFTEDRVATATATAPTAATDQSVNGHRQPEPAVPLTADRQTTTTPPKRSLVSTGVLSILSLLALALAAYAVWLGMTR